jgi:hypothetical protein
MTEEFPKMDVALEVLAHCIAKKSREKIATTDPARKAELEDEIAMLHYETRVIYSGEDMAKRSIYHKIDNLYAPRLKHEFLGT